MFQRLKNFSRTLLTQGTPLKAEENKWVYIFGVLLLLACGFKLYAGLTHTMDIQFADEAAYIRFGLDLFEQMNRNWGPLYSIWYKCLSFFTTDAIRLYYLNFEITSIAVGILLYVFLLRISVKPVFALFIAFSVLVSDFNISVWPRISHFCVILSLLVLIYISYLRNILYKCLAFTVLCLVCSYARPEFYLSFVLMCIITIACFIFLKSTITSKDIYVVGFSIIVIGILHFIFRFPSNDFFGYNRGVAAFYQHYAWNYKWRTHGTFDAWLYWEDIAKKQFGDCNSIWCVIKTQPEIFFGNALFNARTYLMQLLKTVPFIFPISVFHGRKMQLLLTVLLLLIFVFLLVKKPSRNYFIQKIKGYQFYLLLLLCFIFPTLMSCVAVFPRDHYLYLQMLFFILIYSSAFGYLFEHVTLNKVTAAIFGVLLFLSVPNISQYDFMHFSLDKHSLCNKKLINYLQGNFDKKEHVIFTNMPFVRGMLTSNFKELNTIFDKKTHIPFQHYLDSAKIDIVILTPSTFRDPHIKADSTWVKFIDNYKQYGFERRNFTDCEMYLLTKIDSKNLQ